MIKPEQPQLGQVRAQVGGSAQPIVDEIVLKQVQRIIASDLFRRSERLIRFLRFSVDSALSGDKDRVKEFVIGVEVFDRGQSFDPRIDPVVRVEARRLRARLRKWHETEGSDSVIVIDLPIGSYAAEFRYRSASGASEAVRPVTTIAVLPFANLNSDPDLDYFSDGLTEELIHALTRLKDLHVVAWSSASLLKGHQEDIARARDCLHVQHVLRGSVRRSGDRLRMTAQLVSTSDGHYLWSEAWDRSAADLLAIEQEIAQAIVNKLRVDAEPEGSEGFFTQARDPESHTLYLKGRYFWNQRTQEALRSAVACLEEAVEMDPSSPLAWAGLADAHAVTATYNYAPPAESMKAARASALKALSLDPNSGEAMTCLAFVRAVHDWEWEEAEELYRRAIACNPSYATAHHWYGSDYLAVLGRFEEAIEEVDTAIRLDPLSIILRDSKGLVLMVAGRYDEAIRQFRGLLQQDPAVAKTWGSLGRLYSLKGRYDEALAMFGRARALAGNSPKVLGALGQTLALAGQTDKARDVLNLLERLSQTQYVGHSSVSLIHLGLGEHELALKRLERAVDEHEMSALWLNVHPAWDALRSEPGCKAILKRVRLS